MQKESLNQPLISIIIPCYNDASYIKESVDSAINQAYFNKEIIVIDDGSNKTTKEVLKKIEPYINKLITQDNKGQSAARNKGIKEAKGEYILVLDSDDFFEESFCEKSIKLIQKDLSIKIVTSYSNIISEKRKKKYLFKPIGGNISEMLLNNVAMGSCLFKKKDWKESGGYDENMRNGFEDWEFYIRLLKDNGRVEVIKEHLFNYRKRINSTTSKANKIKYDILKYIYQKNEDIYINYFNDFISFLLSRIEREEKEKLKMYSKIEYKIGYNVLKPLRFVKRIFNGK